MVKNIIFNYNKVYVNFHQQLFFAPLWGVKYTIESFVKPV